MNPQPIDFDAVLRSRLLPGEAISWTGAPDGGEMARRSTPLVALGALGVVAFVGWVAQTVNAFAAHSPSAGILSLSLLFVGIPYIVLVGVLFYAPTAAWIRSNRTLYAITDRRVLIMQGTGDGGFESIEPAQIGEVAVRATGRPASDLTVFAAGESRVRAWKLWAIRDSETVADKLRQLSSNASD